MNSRVFGHVVTFSYVNGIWRTKYDDELHKLLKEPNIVQSIKRLNWLGHIRRMDERSLCKK
jgi:hypothetical protein